MVKEQQEQNSGSSSGTANACCANDSPPPTIPTTTGISNGYRREEDEEEVISNNNNHINTQQAEQQNGTVVEENGEEEQLELLPEEPFELIVFGSIVQDLVSYTSCFPKPGESVRGHAFKTFCGGKGANQAVMAAKLGTRVSMIGCVGEDMFAANNKQSIASSGVDISLIQTLKGQSTGTACILVNADGENCIIVTLGANELLGVRRAQQVEPVIARARMILCQQEIDQAGNAEAFRLARKHGVTTFFNPAPGYAGMDRSILPLCDIVCANENEAEFLTGLSLVTLEDAKKCSQRIVEQGAQVVIITLGPRGALVAQRTGKNGQQIRIDQVDAPKVKAVDTVGAGDCFCGSLAHLLLTAAPTATADGEDGVITAVRKAVQIAAISVQKQGAQASYPEREELERQGLLMTATTTATAAKKPMKPAAVPTAAMTMRQTKC